MLKDKFSTSVASNYAHNKCTHKVTITLYEANYILVCASASGSSTLETSTILSSIYQYPHE